MIIPQGLVEVILSEKLSTDEKLEAIPKFAMPILHLDGPFKGQMEDAPIAEEDVRLICRAVAKGQYSVVMTPVGPSINFIFTREDITE